MMTAETQLDRFAKFRLIGGQFDAVTILLYFQHIYSAQKSATENC